MILIFPLVASHTKKRLKQRTDVVTKRAFSLSFFVYGVGATFTVVLSFHKIIVDLTTLVQSRSYHQRERRRKSTMILHEKELINNTKRVGA
jgi:hypothetical protein